MKSRKTRMFTALGLVAISGFSLVAVSFVEAQTKDIKLDPTNARQTIPTIQFRSDIKDGSKYVELTNDRDLLRINTKESNFVLKKGSSDASGRGATILGGNNNHVDNGNYSTIIAGSDNQVNNSSYATIGGGEKNIVQGGYGTVAGGQENTAKTYSTVVGGSKNKAAGDYAVALGNNSEANSDYSVAMGKNAKVSAPNSFLWSDNGATLSSSHSNVFAVVGDNGMVVNKDKAHRFAKLTIGGSIIINSRTSDASTCNSTTVGVVKVTGGSHGQACFCSCNGSKRNSLYGGGDCSSKCDTSITPVCENILIKDCSSSPYSYSGHCRIGEVAEGDGAYMVDKDGKIHWTCQTNDGKTAACVSDVTSTIGGTNGQCAEPNPDGNCSGSYDEDKAEFVAGSDEGFEGIVNATLYNRLSDVPSGTKCAWYCKDGFYKKGDICAPMEGCDEYEEGERHVPYLAHGETRTITNNAGTCTRTATCDNGTPALGEPTCYSCQGSAPSNATMVAGSDQGLSSNVDRTLYANSTAAAGKKCAYLCNLSNGYYYNALTQQCSPNSDWCNKEVVNGCVSPSSAANQNSSDSSKSTWDCVIDGTTMEMGCYKCKDGYTDKGNGVCEREAITINICPKVTYGDCTASALKNCQRGSSLSNLSFEADQLLPKNIDIQVDLNYHFQDPGLGVTPEDGCSYLNEDVNPVYTIANGYKTSDNGGGVFGRYNTMCVSSYGYKKYFDRSFDYNFKDTSTKTYSFTLDGQEYILNLNGICGTTTDTITPEEAPKCGSANNTNRSSAPSTQAEKCENGSPSTISPTSDGWTWTCSKDGVTTNPPCIAYKEPKCGTSNGKTVSSMPEGSAACNPGNRAIPQTGDTQFTWDCGLGPKTVSCSADIAIPSTTPECGRAHLLDSLDAPTSNLCAEGTQSTPVFGMAGEPRVPAWTWTCSNEKGSVDCWSYVPTHAIDCVSIDNRNYSPAVQFNAYDWAYDGVTMNVYMDYECTDNGGYKTTKSGTFPIYYQQSNNIWQNPSMFDGMADCSEVDVLYAEIKSFDPVNKNGNRLIPGLACSADPINGDCGDTPYNCDAGRSKNNREDDSVYTWTCEGIGGGRDDFCTVTYSCQGSAPSNATLVEGSDQGLSANVDRKLYADATAAAGKKCAYLCNSTHEYKNGVCEPKTYSCQGSAPSNATMVAGSDQGLSSNVDRTLYANSTAAAGKKCAYLCNLSNGYYYNALTQQCSPNSDWCNKEVVNGCVSPSSATNQNSSDASKYTWDCAIDGTTMEAGCYKCKDGYTDKGNGVCESEGIRVRFKVVNNGGSSVWLDEVVFDEFPACNYSRPQGEITDVINLSNGGSSVVGDYYSCSSFVTNQKYTAELKARPDYLNSPTMTYATSEFYLNNGDNTVTLNIGSVSEPGECGKATDDDYFSTNVPPSDKLCNKGDYSTPVVKENGTTKALYREWTCSGSPEATCTSAIPTYVFDRCDVNSDFYAGYTKYNVKTSIDVRGAKLIENNGSVTYNCMDTTCKFENSSMKEITSVKYNGNKVGSSIWEQKNGAALNRGTRDSGLCPKEPSGPGVCGSADGTSRPTAPSTMSELCSVGTPSSVWENQLGDEFEWSWTCTLDKQVRCSAENTCASCFEACSQRYGDGCDQYGQGSSDCCRMTDCVRECNRSLGVCCYTVQGHYPCEANENICDVVGYCAPVQRQQGGWFLNPQYGWVCGLSAPGGECRTYSDSSCSSATTTISTCINGTRSPSPSKFSSCS